MGDCRADTGGAQIALERDYLRRLDIAHRHVAQAREQMTIQARRIRFRDIRADRGLDVISPRALDRFAQWLGPRVYGVVTAALAELLDLSITRIPSSRVQNVSQRCLPAGPRHSTSKAVVMS